MAWAESAIDAIRAEAERAPVLSHRRVLALLVQRAEREFARNAPERYRAYAAAREPAKPATTKAHAHGR